jgi:hypothetical protein
MNNQAEKKEGNLFAALIIVIGFFGGFLFYSQIIKPQQIQIAPPKNSQSDLAKFKTLSIDFSVFENQTFKDLKVLGELPVNPGVTGRADLFGL